jgi:hypothetical protein
MLLAWMKQLSRAGKLWSGLSLLLLSPSGQLPAPLLP